MPRMTKLSTYAKNAGIIGRSESRSAPSGIFSSRTMIVMRIAITPSLNASSRPLLIYQVYDLARMPTTPSADLRSQFGEIDIYLFDQVLKGRFDRRGRVMDAGAGDGRNLIYFLRHDFVCFGVDRESAAIARVRELAATLAPQLPAGNFRVA